MAGNNRNREAAIWLTLALVVAILLGSRLGWAGLVIGVVLAAVAFVGYLRGTTDPEVESLRASLRMARDDIEQVLDEFAELQDGSSTDAIAGRTLNYPALMDADTTIPEVQDFHLRVGSAKRFLVRVDQHLVDRDLDRHALERLLAVADQRASDLETAWTDARRAARKNGPNP
ncbi:hypothetical protein [Corynebacterium urinipleomorphum]|uniref:hypothetical protein n=1 Tax=Corynebacterium urinipleomorphum TaxID=1852380 RepID=UPI000B361623|nr:hypothetical protein [Corynebacterium urinipleomorphum]